ncbi:2-hydroxyacid dehydrogenase [Thalassospira sp.]|uniref:2-hydroxyacid dehydrogenase n=1 Tax=Thalassospira sp. TaxID=1912094 RepID=UPI00273439AC|nr:2-hydroxyacid dehydrogenase [Thalassospira sp.]MDP2699855.1 2-hydroxyacid dehydrogenase [Thalassospira sp.]
MKIVFHGANASTFYPGFAGLLDGQHELVLLPDNLESDADRIAYGMADVIIGVKFDANCPEPQNLKLYQVPGAGYDGIELSRLPTNAFFCNCFGHEIAIAEYVMSALLSRHVPLADADARLRKGDWKYWAGGPSGLRTELGDTVIGILGYGHIGKAVARRAKAFGMQVHVTNRSRVEDPGLIDVFWSLERFRDMLPQVDVVVNTLPLAATTTGLVDDTAFASLKQDAVFVNVGRGGVVDEAALYDALSNHRIAHAFIDTWYRYPDKENPAPLPAAKPFHQLANITMTPHMSGWTHGTIKRRRKAMADNVNLISQGRDPLNGISR